MSATGAVLFLPGCGALVGGGHIARCLSLAEAVERLGRSSVFAVGAAGKSLVRRLGGADVAVIDPPAAESDLRGFTHVVLDDYAADERLERFLRSDGRRLLVLDDVVTRPRTADIVLNPGALDQNPYGVPVVGVAYLVGPDYALLRQGFHLLRDAALARPVGERVGRICISFGLSDVGGVALRAYRAVRAWDAAVTVDVVIGSGAPSLGALRAAASSDLSLAVHVDVPDVAEVLAACDVALGAGGVGVWERACLGRPSASASVAANQNALVRALADRGAHLDASPLDDGFEGRCRGALERLVSPGLRAELRARSSALCDGRGADRAAAALLSG